MRDESVQQSSNRFGIAEAMQKHGSDLVIDAAMRLLENKDRIGAYATPAMFGRLVDLMAQAEELRTNGDA